MPLGSRKVIARLFFLRSELAPLLPVVFGARLRGGVLRGLLTFSTPRLLTLAFELRSTEDEAFGVDEWASR